MHFLISLASRVGRWSAASFASCVVAVAAVEAPRVATAQGTTAAAPAAARDLVVFTAKEIVTMDPGWPSASCVAVRDGRIISVGRTMADLAPWIESTRKAGGAVRVDETFKDAVLVPGFVEAHGHPLIGAIALTRPCLSYLPTPNPYGPAFPGVRDLAACEAAMRAYLAANPDNGKPVIFWGYDVVAMGRHLDAAWLDRVCGTRAVFVWDASEHFVYASTAAMAARGVTKADAAINGVQTGADGAPNGQFLGATAAGWLLAPMMTEVLAPAEMPGMMKYLVDLGIKNGLTTTCDMAHGMVAGIEQESELFAKFFRSPLGPLRCVVITAADVAIAEKKDGAVAFVKSLEAKSDDKIIYRGVKFFADDAFLSYGMQITNPGYTDGREGLWMTKPADMVAAYRPWWSAGFQIHTHTNGNAGVSAVIDALAGLQSEHPRFDHRFAIQHYGISTPEDAMRLARLGGVASVNPYYLYARGEINIPYLGTDRAETAARFATLRANGVLTAMHTDTPVAPPHPLECMWIAVNRLGLSGTRVLGEAERVSAYDALRMVTIDAAASLGVDDRVGSIRAGKLADFTVLAESPLKVDPMKIRDIAVWGVVIGGEKHAAADLKPLPAAPAPAPAAAKPRAARDSTPTAAPASAATRSLAARYGAQSSEVDPAKLMAHLNGCRLEFWRSFSRQGTAITLVEPRADNHQGEE